MHVVGWGQPITATKLDHRSWAKANSVEPRKRLVERIGKNGNQIVRAPEKSVIQIEKYSDSGESVIPGQPAFKKKW